MDVQDIRLVVQAMEARPSATPLLLPGTISEVSEDGSTAVLVMDSDPDGITVQARMLFADLGEGDRAMVMFDPPRGVYVVGTVGRRTEAGQVLGHVRREYVEDEEFIAPDLTAQASLTCDYRQGRSYRVDFTFTLSNNENLSWVYGEILNADTGGGTIFTNNYDFFIGHSAGAGEVVFATISGFRFITPLNSVRETLEVFLYPEDGTYLGWFELLVTDAGPAAGV